MLFQYLKHMLYLILSIICSVSVGIIFKVARKYNITVSQVVAWNYVFAALLCYLFFIPEINAIDKSAPWGIYIALSVLLPTIFILLAASIRFMGIVKTDAAQRLSLFIPLLAAWLLFGETFSTYKIIGLITGLPAILLILIKPDNNTAGKWHYPAFVLLGFGIIDILFKQIATRTTLPYTTSLFIVFCGALAIAFLIALYQVIKLKKEISAMNLAFGALVGIFNFGNIYFYLSAHKVFSDNPSTVFATMNMGVIILGSLTGILLFKERLSRLNYIGLIMALGAIVLITLSQLKQ